MADDYPVRDGAGNVIILQANTSGYDDSNDPGSGGSGDMLAENNLSDLEDTTEARANLGVEIGVDVQAYSATLTTLSSTTAAGLALMDDANAAAQRTTLGLLSMATQAASAVAITGGTIDGTPMGATTPAAIQGYRPVNTQTGTTYTFVAGDSGKHVTLSNASAITLTIPPFASVAFPAQAEIDISQFGAGQVTVTPGAGVTIVSYTSKTKLAGQYAGATLKHTATQNTWLLVGNLA